MLCGVFESGKLAIEKTGRHKVSMSLFHPALSQKEKGEQKKLIYILKTYRKMGLP